MNKIVLVILFNLAQVILTILFGIFLRCSFLEIFTILSTWICARILLTLLYNVKIFHYKSPIRCFIMTLALFGSLFIANKINLIIGVFAVIYTSIFLTSIANVKDGSKLVLNNLFQWHNHEGRNFRISKYQDLIDFVEKEPNHPIIQQYAKHWEENYGFRYDIFNLYFVKRYTYLQIIDELDLMDNTEIRDECKIIYSAFEIPLNLRVTDDVKV